MKPASREEVTPEIPDEQSPDAVSILGRVESLIASGLNIGAIARRTEIPEERLHKLLDARDRSSLAADASAVPHSHVFLPNESQDLDALETWLSIYDAERRQAARAYTEIETGQYIAGLAMEALEEKRFFHLIGGYGISKTTTLERFAAKRPMTHDTPGAVYVALKDEDRTAAQIYQRLSDAMRISEKFQARGRSIGQRVRNALRAGDLVIVDEANYAFERGTWPSFRDIYDDSPASVVLVSNILVNGFMNRHRAELGAFLSRVRTRRIEGNVTADGEKYARALGYTCSRLIAEAGKIVMIRGDNGGMRILSKAFEDAEKKAQKVGAVVNVTALREAVKLNLSFFK